MCCSGKNCKRNNRRILFSALHLTEDPAVHLSLTPVGQQQNDANGNNERALEVAYSPGAANNINNNPAGTSAPAGGAGIMNRLFGCFNPLYNMIGKNKPTEMQSKEGE